MKEIGIFFDLDGTLIDSADSIYESFCVAFTSNHQEPPSREHVLKLIGGTLESMFEDSGIPTQEIPQYVAAYKKYYRSIALTKTALLPYAAQAIQEASQYADLAVITTKIQASSERLLHHFNLLHYFYCIIGRDNVLHPKPHAEPILSALQKSDHKYQKIFMIGDTSYDLLSAKNATAILQSPEVIGIGVLSGYGNQKELQNYSPYITQNVLDAIFLIKQLQKL